MQLARLRVSGHDRRATIAQAEHARLVIQPQISFATLFVGPVAREAMVGQDRPDIPPEIHRWASA
jgi:hypothetical protein